MDALTNTRKNMHRLGAWVAARPYVVFLLAAAAIGLASMVITIPPEVR